MQVLVGTHTVLANGGIMAPVGTHVVALAAKHHSCPFVVLTGLHKLSPLFPHDPSVTFNDFRVSLHTGLMQPLYLCHAIAPCLHTADSNLYEATPMCRTDCLHVYIINMLVYAIQCACLEHPMQIPA